MFERGPIFCDMLIFNNGNKKDELQTEKQQPIHSQSALSANGGERWSECAGWEGGIPVTEHNSSAGEIAILTSQS